MPTRLFFFGLAVACLASVASACTSRSGKACYAGDYQACACGPNERGYAMCAADGSGYGACDCSGKTPGLASTPGAGGDGSAGAPSGKKPFQSPCTTNEECEQGLCASFPSRGGSLCTKACTGAADCPAESPGCNPKGECRVP
jgi:hypothetical protein